MDGCDSGQTLLYVLYRYAERLQFRFVGGVFKVKVEAVVDMTVND